MNISQLLNSEESVTLPSGTRVKYNIKVNKCTTIQTLYEYPLGTIVEYPTTSISNNLTECVGHLFQVDPENWINPLRNITYSCGPPEGEHSPVTCELFKDSKQQYISCKKSTKTCASYLFCPKVYNLRAYVYLQARV